MHTRGSLQAEHSTNKEKMMSISWSLKKNFISLAYEDFLLIGGNFCNLVRQYHSSTSKTIITLYKEIPHLDDGYDKMSYYRGNEENHEKVLAVFTAIEDVPKDLFNLAENVQVFVRPDECDSSSNVCGYMECKGLLPHHMVFNVSPDNIGKYVRSLCLSKEFRPSKLWFSQGDGTEKLHHYSLP